MEIYSVVILKYISIFVKITFSFFPSTFVYLKHKLMV